MVALDDCGASANSESVTIYLPAPKLNARLASGGVCLNWPDWAGDWELDVATNLLPPMIWCPLTNAPISSNGQFHVLVSMEIEGKFFRLTSP